MLSFIVCILLGIKLLKLLLVHMCRPWVFCLLTVGSTEAERISVDIMADQVMDMLFGIAMVCYGDNYVSVMNRFIINVYYNLQRAKILGSTTIDPTQIYGILERSEVP